MFRKKYFARSMYLRWRDFIERTRERKLAEMAEIEVDTLIVKLKTLANFVLFLQEEESVVEEEEFTYEDDFDLDLESRRGTMIEGFNIEDQ